MPPLYSPLLALAGCGWISGAELAAALAGNDATPHGRDSADTAATDSAEPDDSQARDSVAETGETGDGGAETGGDSGCAMVSGFVDADGDGYGDPALPVEDCELPEGAVENDDDCDDGDAEVNPAGTEVCGNGKDDDCDGSPGECALTGEVDASAARLTITGSGTTEQLGWAVAGVGDVTGDGVDDLLLGAPYNDDIATDGGAAYLVSGADAGNMESSAAYAVLQGEGLGGWSLAALGDNNGDGLCEFVVGATSAAIAATDGGGAYLFDGAPTGPTPMAAADAVFGADTRGDAAGWSLASLGDVDDDGAPDWGVGYNSWHAVTTGAVVVLPASARGNLREDDASAVIVGEASGDNAGRSLAGPGDVDGDGVDDLVIGSVYLSTYGSHLGGAYLVLGPVSGELALDTVSAGVITGENDNDYVGVVLAAVGDLTGDGTADWAVGATHVSDFNGAVFVETSEISGQGLAIDAPIRIAGSTDEQAGCAIAGNLDANLDGELDLVVGASYNATTSAGAAYLLYGPFASATYTTSAALTVSGASADRMGSSVAVAGDPDGDGVDDLLVGALAADGADSFSGAAYLFALGGW